jgi:hypothetical protein
MYGCESSARPSALRSVKMFCASVASSTKVSGQTSFRISSFGTTRPAPRTRARSISISFGVRRTNSSPRLSVRSEASSEKGPKS